MKNYYFIIGHPFTKKSVHAFVAAVLIFFVSVICVYLFLMAQTQGTVPSTNEANQTQDTPLGSSSTFNKTTISQAQSKSAGGAVESNIDPDSLTDILDAHLRATGMNKLSSYTMRGASREEDEKKRVFSIKGLKPNLYMFSIDYQSESRTIDLGYSGKQIWTRRSWAKETGSGDYINNYVTLSLASIPHLAWSYKSEIALENGTDAVLELMPAEERNGRKCYVVKSRGLLPFEIDHYIDSETLYETYRKASINKHDGSELLVEVEFMQFDKQKGITLPLHHNLYRDGEPAHLAEHQPARINVTMLKILFAPPRGL